MNAIKATLKLCMHVLYFMYDTFKNMSLKGFSKLSWSSPRLSLQKKEEINKLYCFKDSSILNLEFSV